MSFVTVLNNTGNCHGNASVSNFSIADNSESQLVLTNTVSAKSFHTEIHLSRLPATSNVEVSSSLQQIGDNSWKVDGNGSIRITINKTKRSQVGVADSEWIYLQKPKISIFNVGVKQVSCDSTKKITPPSSSSYITPSQNFGFIDMNGTYEIHKNELANNEKLITYVPSKSKMSDRKVQKVESLYFELSKKHTVGCNRNIELTPLPNAQTYVLGKTYSLKQHSSVWVLSTLPVNTYKSTWTHEYIHTRQCYRMKESLQWFSEGSATYYTARYYEDDFKKSHTFSRPVVDFFRQNYTGAQLTTPGDWDYKTEYNRGAKISLYMDYKLQKHNSSLKEFTSHLNSKKGTITQQEFYEILGKSLAEQEVENIRDYVKSKKQIPFKEQYLRETQDVYREK